MDQTTGRSFLQQTGLGLTGLSIGGLVLPAGVHPTLATVSVEEANRVLIQMGAMPKEATPPKDGLKQITPVSYGPWYRPGSPFRAKLSLPGEPGNDLCSLGPRLGVRYEAPAPRRGPRLLAR